MPKVHSTPIAIVDDDPDMLCEFKTYLTDHSYSVEEIDSVEGFREMLDRNSAELMLLDLTFQGTSGFELVRCAREACPSMGIVIVSEESDVIDRVAGLEAGADDFVEKPFHHRELLARIRSVLRRNDENDDICEMPDDDEGDIEQAKSTLPNNGKTIQFCGWTLDPEARTLVASDGRDIELTSGTFDLLTVFASHPNRVLSREQILDMIGNGEADSFDRSIDVQVGRLRRVIENDPKRPAIIKTVRNAGYVLSNDCAS